MLKNSFEENIDAVLREPHAAFLKGILLGDKTFLPRELLDDFKRTGTSHIIALSGYNITIVGAALFQTLLWLTLPFSFCFWAAITGIIFFVLLTGGASSLVRAAIMGILVLVARREGRRYHMTHALVFAGVVMIFQNPYILRFDVGFALSFLATLGLVYISPFVKRKIDLCSMQMRKIFRRHLSISDDIPQSYVKKNNGREELFSSRLQQSAAETLGAQIAVLPLIVYYFGTVSLIALPVNILVLFAVPYAMCAGFIAGMAGFLLTPLAKLLGYGTWVLLEYMIWMIHFFAHIPGAAVEVGQWIVIPVLAVYAAFILSAWRKKLKIENER